MASEYLRIQKDAKRLPPYRESVFTKSFIQKHIKGFQTHLERISHFLLLGKGVWWLQDEDGNVRFTDGDQDSFSARRTKVASLPGSRFPRSA